MPAPRAFRSSTGRCAQLLRRTGGSARSGDQYFAIGMMQSDDFNGGRPVEQRQVVYDTRGHLAELFSKAIHQGSLDCTAHQRRCRNGLLAFLQAYSAILKERLGHYAGTERARLCRGSRGGGVAMPPPSESRWACTTCCMANFVKGRFYEDRLDWQATMLQLQLVEWISIAYRFAERPGKPCARSAPSRKSGEPDNGARVVYSVGGSGRRTASMPTSAFVHCRSQFCATFLPTFRMPQNRRFTECPC